MVGLGRAAMPQLKAGRGRALLPSFPPAHVRSASTASELQPAPHVQPSQTGSHVKLQIFQCVIKALLCQPNVSNEMQM